VASGHSRSVYAASRRSEDVPIRIFAHNMELPDGAKDYVMRKAERLRRIFDGMVTVRVNLDAEKERRTAEITANLAHGPSVVTRVTTNDLREAVDLAFHKIESQIRKHKDKLRDYRAREQSARAARQAPETPPTPEEETGGEATS